MPQKRMQITAEVRDLISLTEAAQIRGVTRAAIHDLVRRGRIGSTTVGGRMLVCRSEVKKYKALPVGRPRKAA